MGLLLLTFLGVGGVMADPATAILTVAVGDPTPLIGDTLVVTFTLEAYDAAENFNDWRVRLAYDSGVLAYQSCAGDPGVWNGGFPAGVQCDTGTAGSVRVGEGNFTSYANPAPLVLGTVTFTVVGEGDAGLAVVTGDPAGDTGFSYYPSGFPLWEPGTVNNASVVASRLRYEWDGSASTDWSTSANWTPEGVPTVNDGARIPTGMPRYPVLTAEAGVYSLTVESGATLGIPDGISLTSEYTVSNYGTLTQTINAVDMWTEFLYIYDTTGVTAAYQGVAISPMGAEGMQTVTVGIRGNQPCTANAGEAVWRCFDITAGVTDTAEIKFHYLESERNGLNASQMMAYHWDGALPWAEAGSFSSLDAVGPAYSVNVINVTEYSPFVLAAPSNPTALSVREFASQDFAVVVAFLVGVGVILAWRRRSH
jgi:hypothetical protein